MSKDITSEILNELRPPARLGRPPVFRRCAHCQREFNATEMKRHQPACARDHQFSPAPPTMPFDLENQALSSDPQERLRQLDQQQQDRIERS